MTLAELRALQAEVCRGFDPAAACPRPHPVSLPRARRAPRPRPEPELDPAEEAAIRQRIQAARVARERGR